MCAGIFACMYVCVRASNPLERALQTVVVSYQVGAGNRTWALWENRQCF